MLFICLRLCWISWFFFIFHHNAWIILFWRKNYVWVWGDIGFWKYHDFYTLNVKRKNISITTFPLCIAWFVAVFLQFCHKAFVVLLYRWIDVSGSDRFKNKAINSSERKLFWYTWFQSTLLRFPFKPNSKDAFKLSFLLKLTFHCKQILKHLFFRRNYK